MMKLMMQLTYSLSGYKTPYSLLCPAHRYIRVATNLENLEYSGISLNMENSGNSQGILCNLGEKLLQTKYF